MNTTYLILGTILAIVSIIETTEGWRDGRKWRERRIAHVFGKRNGADSNIDLPPLFLPRNDQLSILDQEDKSGEDYDQKYATDTDHIPQSVMDRLAYLDVIRRLRPSSSAMLNYWDDIKAYLDYPPEQ